MSKRVVFKVNRPSYQTKSNIVEKTFDKQKDIEQYFINNRVPDGLQVQNIIAGYIATIIKEEEAEPILSAVTREYYQNAVTEYCTATGQKQNNLSNEQLHQLYAAAWQKAYHKANDIFDRIYRGRGNELSIGCVCEEGETPQGEKIRIEYSEEKKERLAAIEKRKQEYLKKMEEAKKQKLEAPKPPEEENEEVYFDDIDGTEDESTEVEAAAASGGGSLADAAQLPGNR